MKDESLRKTYTRGSILDRNGKKLAYSTGPDEKRLHSHSLAYSGLIGYYSATYGASGIESKLNHILTSSDSPFKKKKGADVTLTIDSELQEKAFYLIQDFDGAAVVLNAKSGEILALASSNTFNVNKVEEQWEEINESEGAFYPNAYKNPVTPGSVFKIITSKAIIEAGIDKEKITDDKGYMVINGQTIHNYQGKPSGTISYEEALVHSSNVYFMNRALKIGASKIEKSAKSFLLGEDIPLDFTTLESRFNLGDYSDNLLASTAYGQGETEVTPLQMAMVTQAIANDGVMLKPYLFQSAVNGKGKKLKGFEEGQTKELKKTMKKGTAKKIKKAMTAAGEHYELSLVGNDYQIAAKTGTAERDSSGKNNNAWIVTFAPADDPQYVIVLNKLHTSDIGVSLAPIAERLYEQLFQE